MVACTVGPTYREPPPVAIGGGWSLPVVAGSGSEDYAHWWSTLGDPMLEALVDEALAENLDPYQAVARVDEARAVRDRVAGGRAPVVEAGASVNRRRHSATGSLPIHANPGRGPPTPTPHDRFPATAEQPRNTT